jgi:putative transposase
LPGSGLLVNRERGGKPTDNHASRNSFGIIESFNGKFRAECLNTHWFMSLDDDRSKMEAWRQDDNEVRLHSAIGNKPPIALMNGSPAPLPA